MKILMVLTLSLLSVAHAANNFQNIVSKTFSVSENAVSFTNQPADFFAMTRGSGGDDVGNGGDEVRQKFISASKLIIASVNQNSNWKLIGNKLNSLSTSKIIVVESLKVNNIPLPVAISAGIILLDKESWNTSTGLLSDKIDSRLEILRVIANFSGVSLTEKNLIAIYASMPFYTSLESGERLHAAPWCPIRSSTDKIEKTSETINLSSNNSPEELKVHALDVCQKKGLNECRISQLEYSGFGSSSSYKVTVQGFHYQTRALSKKEQAKAHCLELQRCSALFELSPTGQIPPEAYRALDKEVQSNCSN